MRKALIWGFGLAVLIGILAYVSRMDDGEGSPVSYSEFVRTAEGSGFEEVVVDTGDRTLTGRLADGSVMTSRYAGEGDVAERLRKEGVKVDVVRTESYSVMPVILLGVLVLFLVLLFRLLGKMGSGPGQAIGFTKSKVQRLDPKDINVSLDDVKGIDEAKREVAEFLDFRRDPHRFIRVQAKMPSGIMMVGPSGGGKTMLAKAIACASGLPFFSISGADFVELFVGVGAARVRDTMETVRHNAPCVLFIDEIDAIGRQRGAGFGHVNDERETTLNQMLVEFDGMTSTEGVVLIAATNRPDVLDPALMRPGRFDRKVYVPAPDVDGRLAIIESYVRSRPLLPDVDLKVVARKAYDCTGADLEHIVNEAAIFAARKDAHAIAMADFESALDKHHLGNERRLAMIDAERRRIAVHESGHAIVSTVAEHAHPVTKVTIIPRNLALGLTHTMPEEDRYLTTEEDLRAQLAVLFGGRVAEKLEYGNLSTGAADDLKRAMTIARDMVMRFGMSEKVGPVVCLDDRGPIHLGQTAEPDGSLAEATRKTIDEEIRNILDKAEKTATEILEKHKGYVDALVGELMSHETVSGESVRALLAHAEA